MLELHRLRSTQLLLLPLPKVPRITLRRRRHHEPKLLLLLLSLLLLLLLLWLSILSKRKLAPRVLSVERRRSYHLLLLNRSLVELLLWNERLRVHIHRFISNNGSWRCQFLRKPCFTLLIVAQSFFFLLFLLLLFILFQNLTLKTLLNLVINILSESFFC